MDTPTDTAIEPARHWALVERRGTAAALHALEVGDPARAEIWVHDVVAPALVLGSTQRDESLVDAAACARAGVDVVRRRSGGGAVLLVPGEIGWLDVIVPAGAPGWGRDVHAPMHWIGRHLAAVFSGLLDGSTVTTNGGALIATAWSRTVCFDGLGPGEVSVDGAKLVGISQRRTRAAARLQCSWYHAYDAGELIGLLRPPHRPPAGDLAPVATVAPERSARVAGLLQARLRAEVQADDRGAPGARLGDSGEKMGNNG